MQFVSEVDDQQPTPRQIGLVDSLAMLSDEVTLALAVLARAYFQERLATWGVTREAFVEETGVAIDPHNMHHHFEIQEVLIPRMNGCPINYVFLCGQCDWDEEHGIEFLLKNGLPIQCTAQEGLALSAAWDTYLAQR